MTTQINLLPWREQARQEKKIDFLIILGASLLLTLFFVILIHIYFNGQIKKENARVNFLQSALGDKQVEFTALKNKIQKQAVIEADFKYLTNLRQNSFNAVQVLNELVKIVPSTITLEKLVRQGNAITLVGSAQSELEITLLMKNLDKSPIFSQPILTRITESPVKAVVGRVFELQVQLQNGISN